MALAEPDFLHVLVPAIQEADKGRIYLSKWVLTGGEQDLWLYSDLSADTVGFLFDETGVVSDQLGTSSVAASDNGVLGGGSNFFIGARVEAGTYYLAVSRSREDDGAFNVYYGNGLDQPGGIPEEPGDAEPPVITLDSTVDAIISTGMDADWFKFNVSAETDVVVYATGGVDTIGALLDADGDEVDYNDDAEYFYGDFNFLLARTLEPGDYYIEVTGYVGRFGASTGPYELHVEAVADQSDSRGSAAQDVTLDSSAMGFIREPGDTDYFELDLSGQTGNTLVRVYTVGGTDTVGELQNSGGTSQGENDDGRLSPGHTAFLIEGNLSAGTHYIAVTGFEDETGPYRLVVEEVSDQGAATNTAGELTLGIPVVGKIEAADVDWFKLVLDEQTEVVLYTSGRTDTKAELLDENGASLTAPVTDDDSGEGFNFLIHATLTAGEHYIRVEGFSNTTTGAYALFAEEVVPVGAFSGLDGEHVVGGIRTGHDQGFHKFTLDTESAVWIYTTGALDTYGTLYDSGFNEIASNDDLGLAGLAAPFSIRETLDAGTYYVNVSSYGMGTGGYALHVYPVADPGSSRGSAKTLELGVALPGTIDSGTDADYFRFSFSSNTHNYGSETYFLIDVISAGDVAVEGEVQTSGGGRIDVNMFTYNEGFLLAENFRSGTYYVKVTAPSGPTPYTIILLPHARYAGLASRCAAETYDLRDPQTNQRLFGDPYYACQWHLKNREPLQDGEDVNIEPAWDTVVDGKPVNGEGVNVVVVDNGMDHRHEDLSPNVNRSLNHDYSGGGDIHDPEYHHGTVVAGVVAARDNNIGVRGVAPRATIYGYNFLAEQSSFSEADSMTRNREVTAVSNNSWGPVDVLGFAESFWEAAVMKGTREGYGGKGTFYVFAAGNGALDGDDANLDEFANFYAVTSACGVNDRGTRSDFSVKGSSLWLCAPGGDLRDGYRGLVSTDNSNRYRNRSHGTSFSAPIVSGVAALLRQVNPELTWRDIKLILAASARKNDPSNAGWENGARKYGSDSATDVYHFNHEYGFGVVDAKAAVDLAQDWELVAPMRSKTEPDSGPTVSIPDSNTQVSQSISLTTDMSFIEFVEVNAHFHHTSFRDLEIELVSPGGKISKLVSHYESEEAISLSGPIRLGSAKHLGEDPDGTWTLRMTDKLDNSKSGTLDSWEITVYGHSPTPDAPKAVSVTPGPEKLTVTWEEPEVTRGTIISYDLQYRPTDGGDSTVVDNVWIVGGGDLESEITGLPGSGEYEVEVRAANAAGDGPWSEMAKATTQTATNTCAGGEVLQGILTTIELTLGTHTLIADCGSLLSMRSTLRGSDSLNWSTGLDFDDWDGVIYGFPRGGTSRRVTELDLSGQSLSGRVPAEIGDLTGLEILNLSESELRGSIPRELGGLTELTTLDLSDNDLTGSIPAELGNLTELETLDLSGNDLSGGIPETLGDQDTGTPPQANLINLTTLRLNGNRLSGSIPTKLGNLTSLEELDLSNNTLTGSIPTELSGLTGLENLLLSANQLSGEIPSEVITVFSLTRINLSENRLTGAIPAPTTARPILQFLDLSHNRLSGEIPAGLIHWLGLMELHLAKNDLSGNVPATWNSFSSMEVLDLSDNRLAGGIPAELSDLRMLQKLYLNDNRFTGNLPNWQTRLDDLEDLYLAQNQLTGCIPGGLRNVVNHDQDDLGLPYCDVVLEGLGLEGAKLTNPTEFVPDTTSYQAVAGPSRVTITPIGKSSAIVKFEYRDASDAEIADADSAAGGQQVELGTGNTTVKVAVVSEDDKAERVYQVRFRRAGRPGTPAIDTGGVTAGLGSLDVTWTEPASDGGYEIISYDLRYIESTSPNKGDTYWTVLEDA